MNGRTILRLSLLMAFGGLTAFAIVLEGFEWGFQSHRRAYLAFFGLAVVTLVLVYLSFPKFSEGVSSPPTPEE